MIIKLYKIITKNYKNCKKKYFKYRIMSNTEHI